MCLGMANGGKSLTEDLRKKSSEEAIKSFQEGAERFNESLVESATARFVNTIKADAIKEFAEQVKMAFYYEFDKLIPSIMADKIDELVKEMVGEQG